jgi:hypothetical protein
MEDLVYEAIRSLKKDIVKLSVVEDSENIMKLSNMVEKLQQPLADLFEDTYGKTLLNMFICSDYSRVYKIIEDISSGLTLHCYFVKNEILLQNDRVILGVYFLDNEVKIRTGVMNDGKILYKKVHFVQ